MEKKSQLHGADSSLIFSDPGCFDSTMHSEYDETLNVFVSEEMTDIDDPVLSPHPKPQPQQSLNDSGRNALMSLLSGSQKKKEPKKKEDKKKEAKKEELISELASELTSESNKNIIQMDEPVIIESEPTLAEPTSQEELERKVFSNARSVSALAFLAAPRRKQVVVVSSDPPEVDPELLFQSTPPLQPLSETGSSLSNPIVEDMFFNSSAKRTTPSDVLSSYRPEKKKQKEAREKPKQFKVSLKISPESLRKLQKRIDNPFFSEGLPKITTSGSQKGSTVSAFASLMANAKNNAPKLTPIQQLKQIDPPRLLHRNFHIVPENTPKLSHRNAIKVNIKHLPEKKPRFTSGILELENHVFEFPPCNVANDESKYIIASTTVPNPLSPPNDPVIRRIYDSFVHESISASRESVSWTQLFRPTLCRSLLLPSDTSTRISSWMTEAFNRLKLQSLYAPRNELIKQKKKRSNQNTLFDFVVPDDWEDQSFHDDSGFQNEEEVFVPVLILQGSHGCGKSAAVYAAMEELNGYVHEVNSGQLRSRRDLYSTLKEFCTTQLVHLHSEQNAFQKGIVLFEDVDVLFEQDRTFWVAVRDMINISRKPLVITCNDIATVPKDILQHALDENAVISLGEPVTYYSRARIGEYLWWCCFSQKYVMDSKIIDSVLEDTSINGSFDLRRALVSLQMICHSEIQGYKSVKERANISKSNIENVSLEELARKLDLRSCAEIITVNSHSLIETTEQKNELIDSYIIDSSLHLNQSTLPFELNIGKYISNLMDIDPEANDLESTPITTFNEIRDNITSYTASRTRKLTKIALEANMMFSGRSTRLATASATAASSTMSMTPEIDPELTGVVDYTSSFRIPTPVQLDTWKPDTVGTPDGSVCRYLSRTSFILDLAPQVRTWARFQISMDKAETDSLQQHGISVKKHLEYRDFQGDPTLALQTI